MQIQLETEWQKNLLSEMHSIVPIISPRMVLEVVTKYYELWYASNPADTYRMIQSDLGILKVKVERG